MSTTTIHQDGGNGKPQTGLPVQTGPVYHCPTCGAPARRLIPYSENSLPGGHLDEWGDHVAYLDLPAGCRRAGHPARVAVLGSAVASLTFPYDAGGRATTEECVALIRRTLDALAQEVGPEPAHDPAASIVYRLLAGRLTPDAAVTEINELCHFGVVGALETEPEFAWQGVGR